MWTTLLGIGSFVVRNWKWFGIGALTVTALTLGFNLYNSIRDGAVKDYKIAQQTQIIADQKKAIQFQQDQIEIATQLSEELQAKNLTLEAQYNRIVIDKLGADVDDQAPASLKQLIRQMKQETGR